jgi:hypothetical protein
MLTGVRRLIAALTLSLGGSALADVHGTLVPELRLSAGYDDNLFLDAFPTGRGTSQVRSDAIFDVQPRLLAGLAAGGHVLTLSLDYLERLTLSNGDLRDLLLRLDWQSAGLGPVRLLAGGVYEHYEASQFPSDTFDRGGGEVGLKLAAGPRAFFDARYQVAARNYPDPSSLGQLDTEQRALAGVWGRLHPTLDAELRYAYLHLDSNEASQVLDRHRGDVIFSFRPTAWFLASVDYSLGWEHLPLGLLNSGMLGPRDDILHQLTVYLAARPLAWLEVFARYDLNLSSSTDQAGEWRRNRVQAGLALFWGLQKQWRSRRPSEPTQHAGQVTFRFAGPAQAVSVVGDWNGWDPSASPLERHGAGFEGTYMLPPGRHEYALSVDGRVQAPPDASAYVPDGFGGKNGVLIIP